MKFSCIIPSTGRKTLYAKTLPSVLNQTVKFDDIIVVFDLSQFEVVDPNIDHVTVMCTGGELGGVAARAEAYIRSKSDYVVLLDDDDELELNFLANAKNFLLEISDRPALIIPSVKKIWPEGGIPSMRARPPEKHSSGKSPEDLSVSNWMPSTSSGLILDKSVFPQYPGRKEIKGFNDVQIINAARASRHPIYFAPACVVRFYQYFSIKRLTSDFDSRIKNLNSAAEFGLVFSDDEKREILESGMFSQARSIAFNDGLIEAFGSLMRNSKILRNESSIWSRARTWKNIPIIFLLSITGGISRWRG